MENIMLSFQTYAIKLAVSLLIVFVGFKLIKWAKKLVSGFLERSNVDITLRPFIMSVTDVILKILVLISAVQQAGLKVTSFVAILGAASFAVGLAFQGALENFAGGILLLALRVFQIGDFVEAAGYTGTVESINIFNTTLVTPDNKTVCVPNGDLSNSSIVNYNAKGTRRLDLEFDVSYDHDIDIVKNVMMDVINGNELILPEPAPNVRVTGYGDSAVVFRLRVWSLSSDYWNLRFDLLEETKRRFDKEGISIPYPQMDVHITK